MSVRPRPLLLGLLVILYLHSQVVDGKENECCFSFYTKHIPLADIMKFEKTSSACPVPAVVLTTVKGRVCVYQNADWVQRVMDIIEED